MNNYKWTGITITGATLSGSLSAKTHQHAKDQLRQQCIIVRKLTRTNHFRRKLSVRKIKKLLIMLFTQQLALLINAGINLSLACGILNHGQKNEQVKQAICLIQSDIETGCMLSETLRKQPHFFNSLFCNVIKAGEHSGMLAMMLNKLAQHEKNGAAIKKRITQMLAYPIAVMLIGIIITLLLLTTAIPQFEALFSSFGATLPLITRIVIQISAVVSTYWIYSLLCITTLVIGFHSAYRRSPNIVYRTHKVIIKLPLFGKLLQYVSIARFSRILSILFTAGLPLIDALLLVADVTGNSVYEKAVQAIRQDVSKGESIKNAVVRTQLFPHLVSHMIGIGEESGALDTMLNNIATMYEEKINHTIDTISHFLEPTIMAILGLFVGILVIAMYLPIITLGTVV